MFRINPTANKPSTCKPGIELPALKEVCRHSSHTLCRELVSATASASRGHDSAVKSRLWTGSENGPSGQRAGPGISIGNNGPGQNLKGAGPVQNFTCNKRGCIKGKNNFFVVNPLESSIDAQNNELT